MLDSAQQFVIGVDGGGTGCRAAIGTRSNGIIAQAEAGRANATSAPELAIRNITKAINAAAAKASIEVSALNGAVAHLGLAGVMTSADSQRIAVALPYEDIVVTDDRATAVAGALGGKDGYLLSVGTGTIIAASRSGTFNYVGGWGFHLADQGGGAWLGRAALKHVLMCHDGLASHSNLTRTLFTEFQNDPNAIVEFSMSANPLITAPLHRLLCPVLTRAMCGERNHVTRRRPPYARLKRPRFSARRYNVPFWWGWPKICTVFADRNFKRPG